MLLANLPALALDCSRGSGVHGGGGGYDEAFESRESLGGVRRQNAANGDGPTTRTPLRREVAPAAADAVHGNDGLSPAAAPPQSRPLPSHRGTVDEAAAPADPWRAPRAADRGNDRGAGNGRPLAPSGGLDNGGGGGGGGGGSAAPVLDWPARPGSTTPSVALRSAASAFAGVDSRGGGGVEDSAVGDGVGAVQAGSPRPRPLGRPNRHHFAK
jgi:hypothetical protein